jgi:hypothetical protein
MGRPSIGEKAMSSSERARRHRNKKRLRARRIKEAPVVMREWLLIEAAFREPTRGILENIVRICWAAQRDGYLSNADELVKSWDFIADYLSETMREIASSSAYRATLGLNVSSFKRRVLPG